MEGQVKLRDGKKVGARGGRGAGAGRGGRLRSLCPRSGRLGGWCCASRRRWQVSGRGARGAGLRRAAGGRHPGLRGLARPERGQLARNSQRRRPGGNRRAERAALGPAPAGTLPYPSFPGRLVGAGAGRWGPAGQGGWAAAVRSARAGGALPSPCGQGEHPWGGATPVRLGGLSGVPESESRGDPAGSVHPGSPSHLGWREQRLGLQVRTGVLPLGRRGKARLLGVGGVTGTTQPPSVGSAPPEWEEASRKP